MVETIFVPRGAEERAVRAALGRDSNVRVVSSGIGPLAAARAADDALAAARFGTALVTGLCGALSPAFVVGDALVYRELRAAERRPLALEHALADGIACRLPGAQTGVVGFSAERIVELPSEKRALAARYDATAVDMENYAFVDRLGRAGVAVAVVRIVSDGLRDELPQLGRALDGTGGIDVSALALTLLRTPRRSVRFVGAVRMALRQLRDTVRAVAVPA